MSHNSPGHRQASAQMIDIQSTFDIVCTVHRNQLDKQANQMHFLCIYSTIFVQLYMFRMTISFIISLMVVTGLPVPTTRPSS